MSDEEIVLKRLNETLDVLKGKNVIGRIDFQIRNMVEDCIRIIEKQQKEIEELKTQINEHVYYDLGGRSCGKTELLRHYKKGYDMNNKFWKDKIKAKIEEVKDGTFDAEIILHQLLEKE